MQPPAEPSAARTEMALAVLRQTPGIAGARLVDPAETKRLLEPWLGPSVPLDQLPLRSEEHTSELQSHLNLVCRLLLEKKKKTSLGSVFLTSLVTVMGGKKSILP